MSMEVDERDPVPESEGENAEAEPVAATIRAGDVARAQLKGLIEALVFISEHPLAPNEIAKLADIGDKKVLRSLIDELRQEYSRRGIHLEEIAGGLIFRTNPAYGAHIREAMSKKPVRMTRAQLETLSIVAYRQPITRPEIDDVRGVDSGPVLKTLLDRDLIRILGKKEEPGRPLLYGTSPLFLEFFSLKSLRDLPNLREFTELSDDSRRIFEREMEGTAEESATADVGTLAYAASTVEEKAAAADATDAIEGSDPPGEQGEPA